MRFTPESFFIVNSKTAFFAPAAVLLSLFLFFPFGVSAKGETPSLAQKLPAAFSSPRGLNTYQKDKLEAFLSGTTAPLDTLRLLAVQVQFADSLMGGQPGSLRTQLRDSLYFANELEHLTDYVRGASLQRSVLTWDVTSKLYTLPEGMGYYGSDDHEGVRVVEMMQSVIDSADADVDFSRYQMVLLIHAGAGQETDLAGDSREQITSGFYDQADIDAAFPGTYERGLVTTDSVNGEPYLVDNFAVAPANASQDYADVGTLGIWAFQICSRFGLVPLFDSTPSGFSDSQGVGNFCVMSYGLFNEDGYVPAFPCVFNRMIAGWVDPVTVEPDAAGRTLRLRDVNSPNGADTTCIKIPITESEYYLVVNRVHDTNFDSLFTFFDFDTNFAPDNTDSLGGAEFDFYLTALTNPSGVVYSSYYGGYVPGKHTGSGIYVWHVDENVVRETIAAGYLPDDFVDRKGVDMEEADGVQDMDGSGYIGFVFGSFFDSFRSGDGNASRFGPDTKPNSSANGGAPSGIVLENISRPGPVMTFSVRSALDYEEVRTRCKAAGPSQPATPVDLDEDGNLEIVVLADSGGVYVFDRNGAEYDDLDGNPLTVDPYLSVDGARWTGPPAFGNLDASGDAEIVAASADGKLYAWKSTGEELVDGDGDALTVGVLYAGLPLASPPLLTDFNKDGICDVAVIERGADSLHVVFIDPAGTKFFPGGGTFGSLWPVSVRGHIASPMALAQTDVNRTEGETGIVFSYVDTVASTVGVCYTPAMYTGSVSPVGQPPASPWSYSFAVPGGYAPREYVPSPPAAGDIDADGQDEVVVTLPDGRLLIFENDAGETGDASPLVIRLRAGNPSGPALGDVDLDGTLEIAVWDDEYFYLLKSNGRDATNWPRRIVPESAGEQPPSSAKRALESPVIGDLDGDGTIDVIYPVRDGIIYGFHADGTTTRGFPRVGPAGVQATPSVAELEGADGLSLVVLGTLGLIGSIDTVRDSVVTSAEMTLCIQSLPGSSGSGALFWANYQFDAGRGGRMSRITRLKKSSAVVESGTFMVYPNPVFGDYVHARVTLNRSAQVSVEIYNLEGERAVERKFSANPNGLIDTPFDEIIDVSRLSSGAYFLRLRVDSGAGTESLVKPFAVRR